MKKRRIKKAKVRFLSLCPKGANKLPTIFKDDNSFEVSMLSKGMDEEGLITAIVYAPEFRDSQGDIASAQVIKDMAYEAAQEGYSIDLRHDFKPISKDRAFVAEHFLVQKGDPRFEGLKDYEGNPVDATGSWGVVVKVLDEELKKLYREGAWGGISMAGQAEVVQTEKQNEDDVADKIVERLAKKLNPKKDDTMDEKQFEALTKSVTTAVVTAITEAHKQVTKSAEDEAPKTIDAPVFKGDPTSPADVQEHREALRKHDLQVRLGKAKTSAEVDAILKELKPEASESEQLKKAQDDLKKAQERLNKLEGASNQPPTSTSGTETNLTKEQQQRETGLRMAKIANKLRGYEG